MQDAYSLAESLVDKYESKLRSAQDATCARREAVGLGVGEARTAKQPQGPARGRRASRSRRGRSTRTPRSRCAVRRWSVTAPCGWLRPMGKQPSRAQASAERMLTATQEIVKHTKKTAELLKDGVGGGTMTFQ